MKNHFSLLICFFFITKTVLISQSNYNDSTFPFFEFNSPKNKKEWLKRQTEIRKTAWKLLGKLPEIPSKIDVKIISQEQRPGYKLEHFSFFNGVDATVFGYLLIPDSLKNKAKAVLYHHYHGGDYPQGKNELFKKNWVNTEGVGEGLIKEGYVVMCIDAYGFGERQMTSTDSVKGSNEELTWAKINLWKGRSLFGMVVRDDKMALNYLISRPEVDKNRIAAVGMSFGCLRSLWLAALDERIKTTVAVACITRNQSLIKAGRLRAHGIYYYIPDILNHFDNESVWACIAPRSLLTLSGDQDQNAPFDGVEYINKSIKSVYTLFPQSENFMSVIYGGVKHEYTPAMWLETLKFLKEKL
jgi:dienelactone hydrolase